MLWYGVIKWGRNGNTKNEGGNRNDPMFAKLLSIAFEKPAYQITESELLQIKSIFVGNGSGTGITIYENDKILKDVGIPNKNIKKVDDLAYCKNLTKLMTSINADYSALKTLD